MTDSSAIARTILDQLAGGSRRLSAMTGARDFVALARGVQMHLPRCKRGCTRIVIELDPADTYTVQAFRWLPKSLQWDLLEQAEGVFNDQLPEAFTGLTDLATHL